MAPPPNVQPQDRTLATVAVLATMHGKQHQFDQPFRDHLGWTVHVADIDTDTFGTFTREIPRAGTALATAEAKARAGLVRTGATIGLASEGSFGPHPHSPIIAISTEIAICVHDQLGLVIAEHLTTTDTNFAHHHVRDAHELPDRFLEGVGFPTHGLVVGPRIGAHPPTKGIHDLDQVVRAAAAAAQASDDGFATVETDMRAHHNPTRQKAIAVVADRLARRIATPCPACATPGFGRTDIELGLPCEWCGGPTDLPVAHVYGCQRCDHHRREPVAELAPPGMCPRCNR